MNTRLKEIDDIVNSIKSQNDYELEIEEKIRSFKEKFSNELEGYEHIPSLFKFYSMKPGGYVRYVNLKGQIKYGGILVKAFESEDKSEFNKKNLLLIQNSNSKQWVISWEKNYIFYKKQTKKGDNLRNLFISLLDKDVDSDFKIE
tara:strand:- start:68 stop:502 length:435 start_codon:yes stop_codon:yes gene_type:complete